MNASPLFLSFTRTVHVVSTLLYRVLFKERKDSFHTKMFIVGKGDVRVDSEAMQLANGVFPPPRFLLRSILE